MARLQGQKGRINPVTKKLEFVIGKTLQMGITQTWIKVFFENEQRPKEEKWTDKQIAEFMVKEFPDHNSVLMKSFAAGRWAGVQTVRSRYNRGLLTHKRLPAVRSSRYDERGEVSLPRYSGKKGVKVAKAD